jgi:hypothetical protein
MDQPLQQAGAWSRRETGCLGLSVFIILASARPARGVPLSGADIPA